MGSGDGNLNYVRFEIFTAVTMKNAVFWDVTQCGSCQNPRFGGKCHLRVQGEKNQRGRNNVSSNQQLLLLLLTLLQAR
jgi:hypothetical protein